MPERLSPLLLLLLLAASVAAAPRSALESGNEALGAGRAQEALEHYSSGFVEDPNSPELHYSMGLAYMRDGDPEKAGQSFTRAAELAEASGRRRLAARARYNLGLVLAEPGGAPAPVPAPVPGNRAVLPAAPAPAATPGLPGLPGLAGGGGDLKKALEAFKKAIQLDPGDQDSKYNFLEIRRRLEKQQQQQKQQQKQKKKDQKQDQDQQDQDQDQNQDQNQNQQNQEQDPDQQSQGQKPEGQDGNQGPDQQGEDPQGQPPPGQQPPPPQDQRPQQGGQGPTGQSPQDQKMDRQAMQQMLDALEAEEQEKLKQFLRSRRAAPKKVTHDW